MKVRNVGVFLMQINITALRLNGVYVIQYLMFDVIYYLVASKRKTVKAKTKMDEGILNSSRFLTNKIQ